MDPRIKDHIIFLTRTIAELRQDLIDLYKAQGISTRISGTCADAQLYPLEKCWQQLLDLLGKWDIEIPATQIVQDIRAGIFEKEATPGELATLFKAACKDYSKTEDKVE